jgi:hypothetical protein
VVTSFVWGNPRNPGTQKSISAMGRRRRTFEKSVNMPYILKKQRTQQRIFTKNY